MLAHGFKVSLTGCKRFSRGTCSRKGPLLPLRPISSKASKAYSKDSGEAFSTAGPGRPSSPIHENWQGPLLRSVEEEVNMTANLDEVEEELTGPKARWGRRLVMGVDDTLDSELALKFVLENFYHEGDDVHLLTVIPDRLNRESVGTTPTGAPQLVSSGMEEGVDPSWHQVRADAARKMLHRRFLPVLCSTPAKLDVVFEAEGSSAWSIATTLQSYAERIDASMLVVASHVAGEEAEFGSVARHAAENSRRVPVLMLHGSQIKQALREQQRAEAGESGKGGQEAAQGKDLKAKPQDANLVGSPAEVPGEEIAGAIVEGIEHAVDEGIKMMGFEEGLFGGEISPNAVAKAIADEAAKDGILPAGLIEATMSPGGGTEAQKSKSSSAPGQVGQVPPAMTSSADHWDPLHDDEPAAAPGNQCPLRSAPSNHNLVVSLSRCVHPDANRRLLTWMLNHVHREDDRVHVFLDSDPAAEDTGDKGPDLLRDKAVAPLVDLLRRRGVKHAVYRYVDFGSDGGCQLDELDLDGSQTRSEIRKPTPADRAELDRGRSEDSELFWSSTTMETEFAGPLIAEKAESLGATLVLVGNKRKPMVEEMMSGSIQSYVMAHVKRPLVCLYP